MTRASFGTRGNLGMMSLKPASLSGGKSPTSVETAMSGTVLMALAFLRHASIFDW